MNTSFKKIGLIGILSTAIFGCASENYPRLFHAEQKAPSLTWSDIESLETMGPMIIDRGVNFSVYSEAAERIEIILFDDPESEEISQAYPMTRTGDVWNIYVEGIGIGQHYGYRAWGPNWVFDEDWIPGSIKGFKSDVDFQGNRFNPNKLLSDPYSKSLHRDHNWFGGSPASGPQRTQISLASAAKSVVMAVDSKDDLDTYEWSDHESEWMTARTTDLDWRPWNEVIIYEVHPKGFTMNPSSETTNPGSFEAIGEKAAYLAELGITAVELLPVHEKPSDGGYWGYNNLNFFALENTYSAEWLASGRVDSVIDEFKEMVDKLHQNGIEVIIDVVYNHTGEGGLWRQKLFFERWDGSEDILFDPKEIAGIYSFRGLDNAAWYALSDDNQTYWNGTGVGNMVRNNHVPGRQLILDSLHYMIEELHVDGFRFDLAGVLGEKDLDYNAWIDPRETVLQTIIDDPIIQTHQTRIIAEPWTPNGAGPGVGSFPAASQGLNGGWAEWNDGYRNWWRAFINFDDWFLNDIVPQRNIDGGGTLTGSAALFGDDGRNPYHSVNFVTVHDGFTLYDTVTYDHKQNGCGLLNPKCCEDPLSVWCDTESGEEENRSRNWGSESLKRQMIRNFFTALLISHGTPLILGGDEWMRTQYGNNNSYSTWADNEWNWHRWGEWQSMSSPHRHRMFDFVSKMIELRKNKTGLFSPLNYGDVNVTWKNADGNDMSNEDWSGKSVQANYSAPDEKTTLVLINMEREGRNFSLPSGTWKRIVDTSEWYDTGDLQGEPAGMLSDGSIDPLTSNNIDLDSQTEASNVYGVSGSSIVILEAE